MKKFLVLIYCLFFICSCIAKQGHFTVLTNKMLDPSHFKMPSQEAGTQSEGVSVSHVLSTFEVGEHNLSKAIDSCMEQGSVQSDMLVDVDVTGWFWYVPYIYGQTGWEVKGNAVSSKTQR